MNPAERLLITYDELVKSSPEKSMLNVWADVFALDATAPSLEDEVADCLIALRNQVDFTKGLLVEKHRVPTGLLEPGFGRFRSTASPGMINQAWNGIRGNIQDPTCRHAFTWAAWVLREEAEEDISAEQLQGLQQEIGALEEALLATEMSDFLRTFVRQQLKLIKHALRLHRVRGVHPVTEALHAVAGAFAVNQGRLQAEATAAPEAAKGLLSRATTLIKKTAEFCDDLDKLKKATENVASIAAAVGPLFLPYVVKVFGS